MMNLVYPFLGLAVLVTVGLLGWSMWVYWTTPQDEARLLPKRARLVWRVGMGATVVSVVTVLALVSWALGKTLVGGW